MPLMKDLKKVMIIGSGPIVIGQAAEFDYAGTQACRGLKELGLEVVLVNPNPATIMTDKAIADRIYIEPLTVEVLKRIILREKPDGLLSTIGGQNGLTLSMQLAQEGFLDQQGVKLLGAKLSTIDRAEDRKLFKQTMEEIGQPCIPSAICTELQPALDFAQTIGYPVIVRPAYTLGGSGGGIAKDEAQLHEIARTGLEASPIHQILVERCVSGWKEIEFEVVADADQNVICVCSMENVDPVGVHTGDSIVVAPCLTLSMQEFSMLRTAAFNIVLALGVEGGCNVQFALHPESMEYAVIEVNPRVSRSSALASKATGYPIAKVASQIAVGMRLPEIPNAVTKKTSAFFEPAVDYIVVKFPRWPFDKFVYASRKLGTQMKATGEVMAIASSFEQALMKAVRGAEIKQKSLRMKKLARLTTDELYAAIQEPTDERIFLVYELLYRGEPMEKIHAITMIDNWFLGRILYIAQMEHELSQGALTQEKYLKAKHIGFPDAAIEEISGQKVQQPLHAVYRMVDTCAAEFEAETPYFYATYDQENEAEYFIRRGGMQKKRVIVLGSGPIRIGQGIEFDYASVHCVWTLRQQGCEVIMINNNPETVSTDFDTADRLYFEPLTPEDVMNVIRTEQPYGVVVAFGGQTAIRLTKTLVDNNVRILGTSADSIDAAEDRERFDAILNSLDMQRAAGMGVYTLEEALNAAHTLSYPVLVRPSYVLGGQNMIIAFSDEEITRYMNLILESGPVENPVLIDRYLMGTEVEVDAISDGENVLIPGIMEHIERAGVHSGDSIAVYPAWNLTGPITEKLTECTRKLALALKTQGLINIQYVVYENEVYIIEANPRASRTIPYISKVTGLPIVDLATRVMLGERLEDMDYGVGLYRQASYSAVKVPVFSFEKLADVDTLLGPEMKSTGEVLGVGRTLGEALYKGLLAAGYTVREGAKGAFISVRDRDKREIISTARKLHSLGYSLYATPGTTIALVQAGLPCQPVTRSTEDHHNVWNLLDEGGVSIVISTSDKGVLPQRVSVKLRRKAVERSIICLTSIDTANALADALKSGFSQKNIELIDIAHLPTRKQKMHFVKMRTSGNDFIYFDCFDQQIANPEALAVWLSSRTDSIGGDGLVLMEKSDIADVKMRMYNADGSQAEVSGNAMRCVAMYMYGQHCVFGNRMTIETGSGVKHLRLYVRDGEVYSVAVGMGQANFDAQSVPVSLPEAEIVDAPYEIGGKTFRITCLSTGNPHCVIFVEDSDAVDLEKFGPLLEHAPIFPRRANITFATVEDRTTIRMRVWERGIGITQACGTAACAAAAAAVRLGKCLPGRDITMKLPGGIMVVRIDKNGITLTGDCTRDFEGTIEI
ncbi:MAG: carbamoyl-phosphate synthase large subunit [Eubacteriales bacterium]|nr:carbamoyl-phosphate synthase large subunit [Eubacteriales bacterium]